VLSGRMLPTYQSAMPIHIVASRAPLRCDRIGRTLDKLLLFRPLAQSLLQVIRNPLPLKLRLPGLQGRRSSRIEQDMAVLEVIGLRAKLQMLLEGLAALERREGGGIDAGLGRVGGLLLVGHGCW